MRRLKQVLILLTVILTLAVGMHVSAETPSLVAETTKIEAQVGDKVELKYTFYSTYSVAKVKIAIVQVSTGSQVAYAAKVFTYAPDGASWKQTWDTTGWKPGEYKVVVAQAGCFNVNKSSDRFIDMTSTSSWNGVTDAVIYITLTGNGTGGTGQTDKGDDSQSSSNFITGTHSGLAWSYNEDTKELVISGSGTLLDWIYVPWESYRKKIVTIRIESGVTSIGSEAFRDYSALKTVELADTVTKIGDSAFSGCKSLTNVKLSNGLRQIGSYAFYECQSLTNVKLSNGLRQIGEYAFYECQSLTSITLPTGLTALREGTFKDCSALRDITIPSGVVSLGEAAFEGTAVEKIVIPEGIRVLPHEIFANCYLLTKITIPRSVEVIEDYAFENCFSLKTINYAGKEAEWNQISIGSSGNGYLGAPFLATVVTVATVKLAKVENVSGGAKLTWQGNSSVSGYYIYRKEGSSDWEKIGTKKSGSGTLAYTDKKKLVSGTQYSYMVKAYKGSTVGGGTAKKIVYVAVPKLKSCSSKSKGSITVQWQKDTKATGYQIKYKKGSSAKTVKVNKAASQKYVIKKLTKGAKYSVSIRSYKKLGGKTYYSAWSSARKCIVRKK